MPCTASWRKRQLQTRRLLKAAAASKVQVIVKRSMMHVIAIVSAKLLISRGLHGCGETVAAPVYAFALQTGV
jgi:hypothetical protein